MYALGKGELIMKKKILAALLATVMVFSFTACDKKEDDGVINISDITPIS